MSAPLPADPAALRREKIAARDALSPGEREELSRRIARRVLDSPEFRRARTVLLYRAVRGEVRLEALVRSPDARAKRLAYPRCLDGAGMAALLPQGEDAWERGRCGIWEPRPDRSLPVDPEQLDLVICPCTVFDEAGGRMGMGGGYYDRYLPRCTRAVFAAVAFEVQKAPRTPAAPWDQPMHAVFTEKAAYRPDCRRRS